MKPTKNNSVLVVSEGQEWEGEGVGERLVIVEGLGKDGPSIHLLAFP